MANIVACCANCGYLYDATMGLECPVPTCRNTRIAYAWKSEQPADFWRRKGSPVDWDHSQPLTDLAEQDEPLFDGGGPYPHVTFGMGEGCVRDCDACAWEKERKAAQPAIDELDRMFALVDDRPYKERS